jgi:hypothetical protein
MIARLAEARIPPKRIPIGDTLRNLAFEEIHTRIDEGQEIETTTPIVDR